MNEQVRHVTVIWSVVVLAICGAYFKVCSDQMWMLASAIIGGEYGLSRTGTAVRKDT